jgi:hypothetical protein
MLAAYKHCAPRKGTAACCGAVKQLHYCWAQGGAKDVAHHGTQQTMHAGQRAY